MKSILKNYHTFPETVAKAVWNFWISDLFKKKNMMELILNPCGEFWWSLEGPVSQIHYAHLHVGALGYLFKSFKVCSDAKETEWGAETNGKLPHLLIPSKTATLVPEFAVEDLPLGRTTASV